VQVESREGGNGVSILRQQVQRNKKNSRISRFSI